MQQYGTAFSWKKKNGDLIFQGTLVGRGELMYSLMPLHEVVPNIIRDFSRPRGREVGYLPEATVRSGRNCGISCRARAVSSFRFGFSTTTSSGIGIGRRTVILSNYTSLFISSLCSALYNILERIAVIILNCF